MNENEVEEVVEETMEQETNEEETNNSVEVINLPAETDDYEISEGTALKVAGVAAAGLIALGYGLAKGKDKIDELRYSKMTEKQKALIDAKKAVKEEKKELRKERFENFKSKFRKDNNKDDDEFEEDSDEIIEESEEEKK